MIRLSKAQVLFLHEQLIAETGGAAGLRDEGLLDAALAAPFQTFDGEDVYPSLLQKASRLCFGLVWSKTIRLWMAISALVPMRCWCFWRLMASS